MKINGMRWKESIITVWIIQIIRGENLKKWKTFSFEWWKLSSGWSVLSRRPNQFLQFHFFSLWEWEKKLRIDWNWMAAAPQPLIKRKVNFSFIEGWLLKERNENLWFEWSEWSKGRRPAAANKTNQFTNQIQRQMNLMGIDGLFGGRFQLAFIICLHSLRSFHQITHFASSLTSIPSHSINNSTPVHCWFHLWFHSNVYN